MTINEQTYRDFRNFYRRIKNGHGGDITLAAAAYNYLQSRGSLDVNSDLAVAYLVTGPRCDGDVLTIYEDGIVQVGHRYACSNKIVEG